MIDYQEQMDMFALISKELAKDIECYAFGGTAMMFYGYKDETKDIDLFFEHGQQRDAFISALQAFGFAETSPMKVYIPEKLRDASRPLMFMRDQTRFDLFVNKILHTPLSPRMKEDVFAMHDFKGKRVLRVKVLRSECIVMLKAVTERDRDFEDIVTIIKKDRHFNWQLLIDEAHWQYAHGNQWILLDVEKMMKELKQYVFIEDKYLKQLQMPHKGKRQ